MQVIAFIDEVWRPTTKGLRECTLSGYESALRTHILPFVEGLDLDELDADMIESWLTSFEKAGAARKSWALLRSILRLAVRKGIADNDPSRVFINLTSAFVAVAAHTSTAWPLAASLVQGPTLTMKLVGGLPLRPFQPILTSTTPLATVISEPHQMLSSPLLVKLTLAARFG